MHLSPHAGSVSQTLLAAMVVLVFVITGQDPVLALFTWLTQLGPLFDWLLSGDVPLDESGVLKVSRTSYDYTGPYWDQIGATIVGRHVFDMTDGWDGRPPGGIDHVVVVTHRGRPEGWHPEAPFQFVDGVEAAVAKARQLAGDRMVEVAAGDVGGQVLAAGLVDEVRMDVVPVVFGSGKRFFGSVDAQHLLEDPDVVIEGNRVLHLRYRVIRPNTSSTPQMR